MPNCEETTYTATVSAAPFRRCDFRTLGMHPLCNPARLDDNAGRFSNVDPPFWGTSTLNQYRQVFTKQNTKSSCLQQFPLVGLNYQTTSPIGFMQMNGSMLAPTRFNILVLCITCAFRGPSVFPCLQQRQSAIFTTRLDDNYDAYEKDIAMVSFFFKKNTVFEFKRLVLRW